MELFLVVAVGAALAGFVQGLSGFGFGLTAMSLWAWTLEPRLAATLSLFGALTGQTFSAFTVRRGWDWRTLWPFVAGGIAGIPIGLWLLPRLDVPMFKAVVGGMFVVICPLMFFAPRLPHVRGSRIGDALSGAAGGVMGGLGGFTGVVPTLWCTVRGFDKDRQRSIIQNFNLSTQVVAFASYVAAGFVERSMLPMLAVVAPAMLLPNVLGARVYLGISEAGFRKVVLGLLAASGVAMLASSVPVLIARHATS